MQKDNDPKHTSKSTSEWLKKKRNQGVGVTESVSRPQTPLRCCGGILRDQYINKCLQRTMN